MPAYAKQPDRVRRCDGIVGGPPCPPWSSIGGRKGHTDLRSGPSDKMVEILEDQGQKGCYFFVVEMVPGQGHRRKGATLSDHDVWVRDLEVRAPMWQVWAWKLDSQDYGLPQHRERLYTIGLHKAVQRAVLLPRIAARRSLAEQWADVLHPGIAPIREQHLTRQQQLNLMLAENIACQQTGSTNSIFWAIPVDRDPRQAFGAYLRRDGLSMALRTGNEMIWLLHMESYYCCHAHLLATLA